MHFCPCGEDYSFRWPKYPNAGRAYAASTPRQRVVIFQEEQELCRVSDSMFIDGFIFRGAPPMVGDTVIAQTSAKRY